ncbi:hypothetical protein L2D00_03130 [Hyphomonadaceae bacterium BL14]|nr:hypothetical protein L2D00_03130 [Hyphomonadaceae bacterium BL14]
MAQDVGFIVPPTIFGTDASKLQLLGQGIAYKVIGDRHYPGSAGMTERLNLDFLNGAADKVRQVPSIYQKYIEKEFELRVILSRNESRAIKINFQDSKFGSFDWRRDQFNLTYEPYQMPTRIHEKC